MAFNGNYLAVLAYGTGCTLWQYSTADASSTVRAAGYFNGAVPQLRVGDVVMVISNTGTTAKLSLHKITARAGDVVTHKECLPADLSYDGQYFVLNANSDPTVRLQEAGNNSGSYFDLQDNDNTTGTIFKRNGTAGNAIIDLGAQPTDGASSALVRLFRWVSAAGTRAFQLFRGDGTGTVDHQLTAGASATSFIGGNGGKLAVGKSTAAVTLDCGGTDAARVPAGTVAQRPGSPAAGMLRFNSDAGVFEGYTGSAWVSL